MTRKGISPLIAAVLLIAFTISIAALFGNWVPQLTQDAQGDTSNRTGELQRCSEINLQILRGSGGQVTVQQITGDNAVGNISATWLYENRTILTKYGEIANNRGSDAISSGTAGTLGEIRVSAVDCEGTAQAVFKPN